MVIETSKFQKSFLLQLLQMCLIIWCPTKWAKRLKDLLADKPQQHILWQPIDSNSVTYHSNIFYMMQGLDLDQKEILQASMNDHHNPNDSLHKRLFKFCLSNCHCKINKSINQVPSLQFPKSLPNSPNLSRTHHTVQAKVESLQWMRWVHLPTSTLFWTCQLSI